MVGPVRRGGVGVFALSETPAIVPVAACGSVVEELSVDLKSAADRNPGRAATQRRPGRGPGWAPYGVVAAFLCLIAGGAYWLATQPLDGKGTTSPTQLAAQSTRKPIALHGFHRFQRGDDQDANWRPLP